MVRKTDTVARLGGDEFVILLPDLNSVAQGQRIAELVKWLMDAPVSTPVGEVTVGVSVGLSQYPQDGDDPVALLRLADARMYEDKGRDRASRAAGSGLLAIAGAPRSGSPPVA